MVRTGLRGVAVLIVTVGCDEGALPPAPRVLAQQMAPAWALPGAPAELAPTAPGGWLGEVAAFVAEDQRQIHRHPRGPLVANARHGGAGEAGAAMLPLGSRR